MTGTPVTPAAPPWFRDPWAWLAAFSPLALVLHMRGAPLGEPVADDFDFLRNALLSGRVNPFDGGGLVAYWRPLARQVYYGLLGPLMLSHPLVIGVLHAALLGLAALLLYRVLRLQWSGALAAAAASFVLFAEGNRVMVSWPSHFQDVGAILFAALALHEASRRRLATALAALLAALLCKEIAVVAGVLLPWLPGDPTRTTRERLRWSAATLAVVLAWGATYYWVTHHADVHFARDFLADPAVAAVSWPARFRWAKAHTLYDSFGISGLPESWVAAGCVLFAALALAAGALAAGTAAGRARLRAARPWFLWGVAWYVGATLTLTQIYPHWAPSRSGFGMIGLGIAAVAFLGAGHRALVAAMVVLRLLAFVASPGPPTRLEVGIPATGGRWYLPQLVRMQHMSVAVHRALTTGLPALPHGARIAQHNFPRLTESTFIARTALQVWYRDTTLDWVSFEAFRARPEQPLAGIVEYQPNASPPMALVTPDAMRALLAALESLRAGRADDGLAALDRADALQRDSTARVFRAMVAGKRALVRFERQDLAGAEQEATRALALWADSDDGRYVLAAVLLAQGRLVEAQTEIASLLARYPADPGGLELLRRAEAQASGAK